MAYVQVECSVPRNDKFQKAGPGASWLWLCGLCYCQDGLTDGYIPYSAIDYLGVKNAKRLSEHLVTAGLWHREPGGWRVHDYLKHNKSAIQVRVAKDRRRATGIAGGIASGEARRSTDAKQMLQPSASTTLRSSESKHPANPLVDVAVAASASVAVAVEESSRETKPVDTAFARFQAAYPAPRRKGGYLIEQMFVTAYEALGERLFSVLDNHKSSEQWRNPKLIPGMDIWFREERWRQEFEPPQSQWGAWKPVESV